MSYGATWYRGVKSYRYLLLCNFFTLVLVLLIWISQCFVDLNALRLDSDPGSDADPYELLYGSGSGSWIWKFFIQIQIRIHKSRSACYQFLKKVFFKASEEKISFKKDLSKKQQENIGARIFFHFFGQLGLWIVNFCLQPYTFASYLSHFDLCGSGSVVGIRIRIHKVPEYGSNVDPDL